MFFNDRNEKIVYVGDRGGSDALSCSLAGVTYPNPEYRMVRSPSREYVFEYVVSGRGWIERRGERSEVRAGDFYLYRKGAELVYYADPADPYEKIWLNLDGTLVSRMCDLFRIGEVLIAEANVLDLFLEIHDRLGRIPDPWPPETASDILCALFRILALATRSTYFPPVTELGTLDERIRDYLDANVYADVSLEQVAEAFGITKMHVIRVFKKRYGVTPIQYLLDKKIGISKSLLTGTLMPIKEIAALLRYSSTQHFSSSFKNAVGCTPNQYRQGAGYGGTAGRGGRGFSE